MNRLIAICASLLVAAVLAPVVMNRSISRTSAQGTWPAVIALSPVVAVVGDEVVVRGTGPQTPDGGSCVVSLAHSPVPATCRIDDSGAIAASFRVPTDIRHGDSSVAVCWPGCDGDAPPVVPRDYWQAVATLVVALVVPDIHGASPTTAMNTLRTAGFTWRFEPDPPPQGSIVADQQPAAGSTATVDSVVSLTMTVPTALSLTDTAPAAAGRDVPTAARDRASSLTTPARSEPDFSASTSPSTVSIQQSDQSDSPTTQSLGLVTTGPANSSPSNLRSDHSAPWLWPVICGLVLLLSSAGLLAFRRMSPRRQIQRGPEQHITVRASPGPIFVTTAPAGHAHQDHTYQLITHELPGSITVQEYTR